jgi:hypothetical protein
MLRRVAGHVLGVMLVTACAVSPHTVPATASTPPAIETTSSKELPGDAGEPVSEAVAIQDIPTECASTDPCTPDPEFVKRLCSGSYPEVALLLMAKGAPFTRMYLRGDVDGWNAESGLNNRARLVFDEEVLVLRRRKAPAGSIVVSSGDGFLVMRWDGYCYTVTENEITAKKPPTVKSSAIPWKAYSERTKDALLKNANIQTAFQRRRKECNNLETEAARSACERAELAFSAAVADEVRAGATIPTPERRP